MNIPHPEQAAHRSCAPRVDRPTSSPMGPDDVRVKIPCRITRESVTATLSDGTFIRIYLQLFRHMDTGDVLTWNVLRVANRHGCNMPMDDPEIRRYTDSLDIHVSVF